MSASIRGGREYGAAWHEAGPKLRKQSVFDDVIATAEWLVANKLTSPAKLAINGGPLVGAVINQRSELFAAVAPKLIRIETQAGHGAGKPTPKVIEERGDILAFIAQAVKLSVQ